MIDVLSDVTGDGFVFRVDLRLRPNGSSGPLALGFDAMEQYYQTHGREWERYAMIKARVVAGGALGEVLLESACDRLCIASTSTTVRCRHCAT